MFCTFLDVMKAFDRVNYIKLFKLLVFPPVSVWLLLNMYTSQVCCVSGNEVCSFPFSVLNGVKQGEVISPVFFCINFDELLGKLADAGIGCYIRNIFVGAVAYADDIVLLALMARAMWLMLRICDHCALEYSILFNAKKSKCISFELPKNNLPAFF